jgi:hypothetical protein
MEQRTASNEPPVIGKIGRRRFLAILAGGTVAVAAATVRLSFPTRATAPAETAGSPIRNPAFLPVPGDRPGHRVLFCRRPDGEYMAYDLNTSAFRIWQSCGECSPTATRPSLSAIAERVGMEVRSVRSFALAMQAHGLVYFADAASVNLFAYEVTCG